MESDTGNPGPDSNYAKWIGHSTLLCRQDGIFFLTDPIFSMRSSPFSFIGPVRYSPPAISIDLLPKISFVLISHNHYDHLDLSSVKALHEKDKPLFIVPNGLGVWFESAGIRNWVELGWWSNRMVEGLKVTAVPARHFSARSMWDRNSSHWCGFIVSGRKKFYYSGDSGYCGVFTQIGERFGPIDLAALPIGAYEPQWIMKSHHLTPEEALKVFGEIGARKFLAVHWGTFDLTEEPYEEPPARLKKEADLKGYDGETVVIPKIGQTVSW